MLYLNERFEPFFKAYHKYNFRDSDWFGGVYFDERGNLCVQIVEERQCEPIPSDIKNEHIRFTRGRYSFRELSKLCREILSGPDSAARGIVGAGIDIKNSGITLAVTKDFKDTDILLGRDEFSVERLDWLKTDISLRPADKLTNGKCYFTAGYPAKTAEKVRGIVTAGHLSEIEEGMGVFYGENKIGTVTDFEFSSVMDAAFIGLDGGVKCSDEISVAPNPRINGLAPEYICGAVVEKYSESDGAARMGTVAYPTFDFMNIKNISVFTYSAAAGDSGAPILMPFASGKYSLAGIHLGTFSLGGTVYSYGRRAKDINERFSLKLDVKK
ncbi:MAG: S1 family peptidase [Lachnospiraceae bacterium]|nr:S1 family peptidase [Ruminococcus sp.]MCM1276530.1 S1 family peptidase [Lachnospiraceae bacterium]